MHEVHGPIVCEGSGRDGDVSNYFEQHVKTLCQSQTKEEFKN